MPSNYFSKTQHFFPHLVSWHILVLLPSLSPTSLTQPSNPAWASLPFGSLSSLWSLSTMVVVFYLFHKNTIAIQYEMRHLLNCANSYLKRIFFFFECMTLSKNFKKSKCKINVCVIIKLLNVFDYSKIYYLCWYIL